jgi:paraquat-inducible protein A
VFVDRTDKRPSALVSCQDCGLLQRRVLLPLGARASCARCHAVLYQQRPLRLEVLLAMTLSSCLMFVSANLFPMMSLQSKGAQSSTTLIGAIAALWQQDMQPVAVVMFLTTMLAPCLELALLAYLLIPLYCRRAPRGFVPLMRVLQWVHPWGMSEVFLMGVLVALVKLGRLAEVVPGAGLWSFCALIILLTVNAGFLDTQGLWRCYRSLRQP